MELTVRTRDVWYEPKFQDNRELPEEDRCAILLKSLTYTERQDALLQDLASEEDAESLKNKLIKSASLNLLRASIIDTKNLIIKDMSGEDLTVNADTLLEYAPQPFLMELYVAISDMNFLKEGLKKT